MGYFSKIPFCDFFIELRAVVLKLFSYSIYNSKHLNVQKNVEVRTPDLGASFKKFKIRENIPKY